MVALIQQHSKIRPGQAEEGKNQRSPLYSSITIRPGQADESLPAIIYVYNHCSNYTSRKLRNAVGYAVQCPCKNNKANGTGRATLRNMNGTYTEEI